MRSCLVILIFSIATYSFAQTVADCVIPSNACLNETIKLRNQSTNAVSYEWDFCQGDLTGLPTAKNLGGSFVVSNSPGIKMIFDGTNWFGFAIDKINNSILRLDFGTSIDNPLPITNNLGNIGTAIISPIAIDIVFSNGSWYGFVLGDNTSVITRIDFGTSLTEPSNQLVATTLLADAPQASYGDINLVFEFNQWHIIFTRVFSVHVARLATITSIPTPTDFVTTGDVSSVFNYLAQIKVAKSNGTWYGYTVSVGNNKLVRLIFGSSLFNIPTYQDITGSWIGSSTPTSLGIGVDTGSYYLIVGTNNGLARVTLGSDLSTSPTGVFLGNLSVLAQINKMDLFKHKGVWRAFVCSTFSSDLFSISFPDANCGNTISTQFEPTVIYPILGAKGISLKAYSDAINYVEVSKSLTISSLPAPTISIDYTNSCVTSMIGFTYQSPQVINSFNWNFGDSNSSASPNPSHQYALAGKYLAGINVIAGNGCGNYTSAAVNIYNPPSSAFTLPTGLICTNQNYMFTNTTTFGIGSSPTWQWNVNGTNFAITKNLEYSIPTATFQTITLNATIPGCTSQSTQTISSVEEGPLAGFTQPNNYCQAVSIPFTNATSGSVTSYSWTFGDGNTSSSINVSNTYFNVGTFNVTLQANNAAGCQNSLTKTITIHTNPQPDFSLDLPPFSCSGTPSQFNDLTPSPTDSNLTQWSWSFGDAAYGIAAIRNPTYTYSLAGSYDVSLKTTTNFGCAATKLKTIQIAESPKPDFTRSASCVSKPTLFTDASGANNKSWFWKIGGTSYAIQNPMHVFTASGNFTAQLTVTGNNNCISVLSKLINVPVPAALDFSVQNNCAGQSTEFRDVTSQNADSAISRLWDFAGKGSGSGASPQFSFPTPGSYNVKLTVTNQSGCSYSLAKNTSIVKSPVANFSSSLESGPPPLAVQFTNSSLNASAYQWRFNDLNNSVSLLESPSFTYPSLGDFNVDLIASNIQGCMDKKSKVIHVIIPRTEIELEEFTLLRNATTGSVRPVLTIRNNSNYTINNVEVVVDIAGTALVKEKISATILPNASSSQILNYELLPSRAPLDYLCVELRLTDDRLSDDMDLMNNSACISLQSKEILFPPYPNPVHEQLSMDWIALSEGSVKVSVISQMGQLAFQKVADVGVGLNLITLDLSKLNSGFYILIFESAEIKKTFPFVIQH